MNNKTAKVITAGSDTVTIDIDTLGFNPFVDAGIYHQYPAMAVPAGSGIIPGEYVPTVSLIDRFDPVLTCANFAI